LRGDGGRLVLRISAYTWPEMTDGMDANFLSGEVELRVGVSAPFHVKMPVKLHTEDLARFQGELERLDRELAGQAVLSNVDSDLQTTVTLASGKGTISGLVRESGTALRFKEVPVDQTYVREALQDFRAISAAFPIRGRPWD